MKLLLDLSIIPATVIIFLLSLFTLLIFQVGKPFRSNIYLGIYFLSQIIGVLYFTISPYIKGSFSWLFFAFGQSVVTMWGAFFYLYFISLIQYRFRLKKKYIWHFMPFVLTFLIISYVYGLNGKIWFIPNKSGSLNLEKILSAEFFALIFTYIILSIFKYKSFKRKDKTDQKEYKRIPDIWVGFVLYGFIISSVIVSIINLLFFKTGTKGLNHFFSSYTVFLPYFSVLFYLSISKKTIFINFEEKEKYKGSRLTNSEASRLLHILDMRMESEKLFADSNLNLNLLAEKLQISYRQLSQLINEYKNQNFSDYINKFRIKYAVELLEKQANTNATIYAIMLDSGFNSKSTFNSAFKKTVGCTPAQYRSRIKFG